MNHLKLNHFLHTFNYIIVHDDYYYNWNFITVSKLSALDRNNERI